MRRIVYLSLATLLAIGIAYPGQARAQEAFSGSWTVAKADTAPWASSAPKPDAELRAILGKTVTFLKTHIDGPPPLRCAKLKYEIRDYTPDMLFQGALDKDPEQQAKALGFKASPIKTLETGCGNELDFHLVDADTALFGLNDRIYTLARKKP
jgi:hypothetical protein